MKKKNSFFNKMIPLVAFQLSDKLDFSWTKSKKDLIQKIVFNVLKFVIIAGVIAAMLCVFSLLGIINKVEMVDLYVLFFTLIMILLLLGDTHKLTMSLYYAEDNKLLVTFPVSSTKLFFSKIINFFIFDFIKNLNLLIPVTFGFAIGGIILGQIQVSAVGFAGALLTIGRLLWLFIPLMTASAIIVLLASLLSVPYLFIYRLFKTLPILELVVLLCITALIIIGVTAAIGLIPSDIDLINQWPSMRKTAQDFIADICMKVYPFTFVVKSMFGKHGTTYLGYRLLGSCFVDYAIVLGVFVVLLAICYFLIKPFFFYMMTKSFEFDKNIIDEPKPNIKREKYLTFVNKELVLSIRDIDISGSFLLVYILAPIMLYFINTVFSSISKNLGGDMMVYAFNVLLMILPYLASNSIIATIYSREGRAAYMKKTKPINLIFPLSSKVFVYILCSIISIVACGIVFSNFTAATGLGVACPILFTITVCFLQIGHMYYSATLDIMNPQNESYATTGSSENNQNENRSTIVAFVGSIIFAIVSYLLMSETHLADGNYLIAFIKMLVISIFIAASCFTLFVLKVKAYYYEK